MNSGNNYEFWKQVSNLQKNFITYLIHLKSKNLIVLEIEVLNILIEKFSYFKI